MTNYAMNQIVCEQFVSSIFNSLLSDCRTSSSEQQVKLQMPKDNFISSNSGNKEGDSNILIKLFNDPKFLSEIYTTSDMIKYYRNNKDDYDKYNNIKYQ